MKKLLLPLATVAALAGCATEQPVVAGEDTSLRVAPTGSNMLRKQPASRADGVTSYDRDALEEGRRNAVPVSPVGGGPR
jgi:hypothetical protein